jgi:hypothetical protein
MDEWELTVLDYVSDAWAQIPTQNYNPTPKPDQRVVMIRIRLRNVASAMYFDPADALKLVSGELCSRP